MRTPVIVGMDPGAEKGYALIDPEQMRDRKYDLRAPRVLAMSTTLAGLIEAAPPLVLKVRPVWVGVEFQYGQRVSTGEISADSIIKLAFRAGYMLDEARHVLAAEEAFAAVPQRWKPEVFMAGCNLAKSVFTERLFRCLEPDEVVMLKAIANENEDNVDDVLDGVGFAWAIAHAMKYPGRLSDWRTNPDRIIPLDKATMRRRKILAAARRQTKGKS